MGHYASRIPWVPLAGANRTFPVSERPDRLTQLCGVMELREERRRRLMIMQIFESLEDFKFTVLTVLHPSCEHY